MLCVDLDEDDRPEIPPKILETEVLHNPFPDIVRLVSCAAGDLCHTIPLVYNVPRLVVAEAVLMVFFKMHRLLQSS